MSNQCTNADTGELNTEEKSDVACSVAHSSGEQRWRLIYSTDESGAAVEKTSLDRLVRAIKDGAAVRVVVDECGGTYHAFEATSVRIELDQTGTPVVYASSRPELATDLWQSGESRRHDNNQNEIFTHRTRALAWTAHFYAILVNSRGRYEKYVYQRYPDDYAGWAEKGRPEQAFNVRQFPMRWLVL